MILFQKLLPYFFPSIFDLKDLIAYGEKNEESGDEDDSEDEESDGNNDSCETLCKSKGRKCEEVDKQDGIEAKKKRLD